MKWLRNYRLRVQSEKEGIDLVIESPLTLQFTVTRNRASSLNNATFAVYNLARETYKDIFQDRFTFYQGTTGELIYRRVSLEVGYGGEYIEIFRGNLLESSTQRQGSNLVTVIQAQDGGFDTTTTKTFQTYEVGSVRELLTQLMGEMPNLNIGAVGEIDRKFERPVVINSNTWEAIKLYSNRAAFIDMETMHILEPNEVIEVEGASPEVETGLAPLISSETGLLGTPRKENNFITVDTLLEPRILMGQYVMLRSDIMPIYNGVYAVFAVTHQGIISGAVGGECRSSFGLLVSNAYYGKLKTVKPITARVNLESPEAQ